MSVDEILNEWYNVYSKRKESIIQMEKIITKNISLNMSQTEREKGQALFNDFLETIKGVKNPSTDEATIEDLSFIGSCFREIASIETKRDKIIWTLGNKTTALISVMKMENNARKESIRRMYAICDYISRTIEFFSSWKGEGSILSALIKLEEENLKVEKMLNGMKHSDLLKGKADSVRAKVNNMISEESKVVDTLDDAVSHIASNLAGRIPVTYTHKDENLWDGFYDMADKQFECIEVSATPSKLNNFFVEQKMSCGIIKNLIDNFPEDKYFAVNLKGTSASLSVYKSEVSSEDKSVLDIFYINTQKDGGIHAGFGTIESNASSLHIKGFPSANENLCILLMLDLLGRTLKKRKII